MSPPSKSLQETKDLVQAALIGHAVGDALGVPVEFEPREIRVKDPVTNMRGYGTHHQPAGTWSDDTSLTLCTAESLCAGYDLTHMGQLMVDWLRNGRWTPHGQVFDIGITTRTAIAKLEAGAAPTQAGPTTEGSNGNGSLMRILPLALYTAKQSTKQRLTSAMECSKLTHGHPRSQLACAYFCETVSGLANGFDLNRALSQAQNKITNVIRKSYPEEEHVFARLLSPHLNKTDAQDISGDGYVIHSLEASLWCCMNTSSYRDAVLKAINLGDDTDTTGAITGGLAAIIYGKESIPIEWQKQLTRHAEIKSLAQAFSHACHKSWLQL